MRGENQRTNCMSTKRLSGLTTKYWNDISPGSTVTFKSPQGQERKGKVVMAFPTHLVLNCGGAHGTPAVVDEKNYVSHTSSKKRRG